MPVLSKTVEVGADAASIMAIVADFEAYPQWNEPIKGVWILARYDDGRPSQLRLDTEINGMPGTYIQAVYYPGENQIQTVMQQGDLFAKQEQLFSVVETGTDLLADGGRRRRVHPAGARADGEDASQQRARQPRRKPQAARRGVGRQLGSAPSVRICTVLTACPRTNTHVRAKGS